MFSVFLSAETSTIAVCFFRIAAPITGLFMSVSAKTALIAVGQFMNVFTVIVDAAIRLACPRMDMRTLNSDNLPESESIVSSAELLVIPASTEFKSLIARNDDMFYFLLIRDARFGLQ
jgi:hypothetical protein